MATVTKEQILELCTLIEDNTSYLNNGGCGVFAYGLGRVLSKFDNCEVKVKVANAENPKANINHLVPKDKTKVSNWHDNGVQFYHILLEVTLDGEVFMLDSSGVQTNSVWGIMEGAIPLGYISSLVKSTNGWNKLFDRSQMNYIFREIRKWGRSLGLYKIGLSCNGWEVVPKTAPKVKKRKPAKRSTSPFSSLDLDWAFYKLYC